MNIVTNNNKTFFIPTTTTTTCQENMAIYNKNQQQPSILNMTSGYFQKTDVHPPHQQPINIDMSLNTFSIRFTLFFCQKMH